MAKRKRDLNTIYISERLQECLRPISRCALTTVVAPMGYGKTTAVNWYLGERAGTEPLRAVRISVYSDNVAIFWKSVQDAFSYAGLPLLRDYACPSDAAGASLLADDLCHALAGPESCYVFIDDFHLLTDGRITGFICTLANRLPENVHMIIASRDRFLPSEEALRLGGRAYQIGIEQLRLNHTELSVYAHRCGTDLTDEQIETLLYSSEGWFSAVYLNLRTLSERGALPDRTSDIYTMFSAAMIDPLPPKQREFLAVMGLADEFTAEMAQFVTGNRNTAALLTALTEQNAFVKRLPDGFVMPFAENYRYLKPLLAELPGTGFTARIMALGEEEERRCRKLSCPAVFAALTQREQQIAALIADRLSNREIAEELFLSEGSVKQYVNQIYGKLGIEGDVRTKRKRLAELAKS